MGCIILYHIAVTDGFAVSANLFLTLLRFHRLEYVFDLLIPLLPHYTHLKFSFPAPISKCSLTMPRSILV
jgi:hypothetical protein